LEEHRKVENGREALNLDPVSGRCLDCLIKLVREGFQRRVMVPERDWQKAAAGDSDE
jgi:hypothetical protein